MAIERVPAGADDGVGSAAAGSAPSASFAASAIDVSISIRSKSTVPSRRSCSGTSRPSRRQIRHASTHIAFADPADRSSCHSA